MKRLFLLLSLLLIVGCSIKPQTEDNTIHFVPIEEIEEQQNDTSEKVDLYKELDENGTLSNETYEKINNSFVEINTTQ